MSQPAAGLIAQLEQERGVRVPADLRALWTEPDAAAIVPGGNFAELLGPGQILDADMPMLPIDFLPIAGDGTGSYLCLRVGPHGDVIEIVFWEHDVWTHALPYGASVAEAMLVAAAVVEDDDLAAAERAARWAARHVSPDLATAVRAAVGGGKSGRLARDLVSRGIGVESLGEPGLEAHGARVTIRDPHFQAYYGVAELLAPKLGAGLWYDLGTLPARVHTILEEDYGGIKEPPWTTLASAATRVIGKRADIGWAWILRADTAGKRGEEAEAKRAITEASRCLERTFDVHGRDLLEGVKSLADDDDALVRAFFEHDDHAVATHWWAIAADAEERGDWATAWDAWYRRVHHARSIQRSDAAILGAYARCAERGGFAAWTKLVAARQSR